MSDANRNWAGNIAYGTDSVLTPGTLVELQETVRRVRKARALGSRHSFNRIADTGGDLISLKRLDRVLSIDSATGTVRVEGGITYGQLSPALHAAGFALRNLASLPHISVAGAAATGTHGSGNTNQNLATAIAALDIVTASGEIVALRRGDAGFDGAVVNLGALGIVSALTLDIVPTFDVRQTLYVDLPFDAYVDNFEAITASAYSVSAFTHWQGETIAHVWLKALAGAPQRSGDFFGARPAGRPYHPIAALDPAPATEQLGVPGPWHLRLPHFRMEFSPSAGAELQTEYFVPRRDGPAALRALHDIQDQFSSHLMVSELRTIAADRLWLSTAFRRDSLAFHFTWHPDWPAVQKVLPIIESALRPFGVRPHWGKLFTMPKADVQARWPKLGEFRELATGFDPDGKFRNAFMDEFVF